MTGRSPPGGSGADAGVFLFVVSGVVAGGSLLVWMAGAIAGVLAGSAPVLVGFSEAASVVSRLPRHLGDPAAAWPATVRAELPGRTTLLIALVVAVMLLVALVVPIAWASAARAAPAGRAGRARAGPTAATCAPCASRVPSATGSSSAATSAG